MKHLGEGRAVAARRGPFHAKEHIELIGLTASPDVTLEVRQERLGRGRVVASQKRGAVGNLRLDESSRESQAPRWIASHRVLAPAKLDVLVGHSMCDAVEPAAARQVADGNASLAEFLDHRRRHVDAPEKDKLRGLSEPRLAEYFVVVDDL
jgi:hypothetical protein